MIEQEHIILYDCPPVPDTVKLLQVACRRVFSCQLQLVTIYTSQ